MAAKSATKPAAKKPATTLPPAKTLVQLAKAMPPPRPASFLDKLPAEIAQQFIDLRDAYLAKRLPAHMSPTRIYRDVVAVNHPDACSEATFRKWMARSNG